MFKFRFAAGGVALFLFCGVPLFIQAEDKTADKAATPGYLGIKVGPAKEQGKGIAVMEVTPGSPADKAGLKVGDVITSVNGVALKVNEKDVKEADALRNAMAQAKPNQKVMLGVLRGSKEQTVTVTPGEQPRGRGDVPPVPPAPLPPRQPEARREVPPASEPPEPGQPTTRPRAPAFLGVQTEEITPELRGRLNTQAESGVIVGDVLPNSPADRAGLKRDDIITAVDGNAVRNPMELRDAILKAGVGKEVSVSVLRGKEKTTLKAKLGEGPGRFRGQPGGEQQFAPPDIEMFWDRSGGRVRELERRVEELEKRLNALEKKPNTPSK